MECKWFLQDFSTRIPKEEALSRGSRSFHQGESRSQPHICLSSKLTHISNKPYLLDLSSPIKPGQSRSIEHGCCHTFLISNSYGYNVVITILRSSFSRFSNLRIVTYLVLVFFFFQGLIFQIRALDSVSWGTFLL
jgi:hypothetical protein